MTIIQSIILGIVQGLTEFLPVSSSAHLVLVPYFLGWKIPTDQVFIFDVLVQLGTLAAVIIYFWRPLWGIIRAFVSGILRGKPFAEFESRLGWYLILATIPAGILGLLIKDQVEAAFNSPLATGFFLLVTAAILIAAERLSRKNRPLESMTWLDALAAGAAQAISIFPGVSRSGSTIAGGMSRGLTRKDAAQFSFLMSIPVMLAAGLLAGSDMAAMPGLGDFLPVVLAGFLAAAVVGYASIHWLLKFLTRRPLYIFAMYCSLLGMITIIVAYVR
jgi:undecaprenyl-diphosphatase